MADAVSVLSASLNQLDECVLEYVCSIVDDLTIDNSEKIELISEYLTESSFELKNFIVEQFVQNRVKEHAKPIPATLTPTSVALSALLNNNSPSAPIVAIQTASDKAMLRDLLRRYEDGHLSEDNEEIHGLGPNENRLRISREREEARARAKKEQEEAHDARVLEKLKTQGDTMRDRTSRRKK